MFSDSVLDVKYPYLSNEQGELPVLHLEVFLFTCSVLCLVWGDAIFTLDHLSKHRRTAAIPVILLMCSRVLCPPLFSWVYFCLCFPFFHCTPPLWYFVWFSTSISLVLLLVLPHLFPAVPWPAPQCPPVQLPDTPAPCTFSSPSVPPVYKH